MQIEPFLFADWSNKRPGLTIRAYVHFLKFWPMPLDGIIRIAVFADAKAIWEFGFFLVR